MVQFPRFVANMTMGEMVDSSARCKYRYPTYVPEKDVKKIRYICYLPLSIRIGKDCTRGLEYCPMQQAEGHTQDRGHSFFHSGLTKASK